MVFDPRMLLYHRLLRPCRDQRLNNGVPDDYYWRCLCFAKTLHGCHLLLTLAGQYDFNLLNYIMRVSKCWFNSLQLGITMIDSSVRDPGIGLRCNSRTFAATELSRYFPKFATVELIPFHSFGMEDAGSYPIGWGFPEYHDKAPFPKAWGHPTAVAELPVWIRRLDSPLEVAFMTPFA